MTWNSERVGILKTLWADGFSASQIAERLGGVTRNAVLGKVHRLRLPPRATVGRRTSCTPRARAGSERTLKAAGKGNAVLRKLYGNVALPGTLPPAEEPVIPIAERRYIDTLTACCCRWPFGDPKQPDFHFCGRTKVPSLPYCEAHALRAFQAPKARQPGHVLVRPVAQRELANGVSI